MCLFTKLPAVQCWRNAVGRTDDFYINLPCLSHSLCKHFISGHFPWNLCNYLKHFRWIFLDFVFVAYKGPQWGHSLSPFQKIASLHYGPKPQLAVNFQFLRKFSRSQIYGKKTSMPIDLNYKVERVLLI